MKRPTLIILITIVGLFFICCFNPNKNPVLIDAWNRTDSILLQIKEPTFPDKIFNILDFGAIPDNKTLNTIAIANAINRASIKGGGTVLIPEGTFLTGAIHLKNNIRLHLEDKAILNFSTNPSDYLPVVLTRWEGIDCYNYSPLIYGKDLENIAITGNGKLNGQADTNHWWPWKGITFYGWESGEPSQLLPEGRPLLTKFNADQTPVENRQMGEGHYLRPPFIQLYNCKNILIQDVTIENSPFWVLHPLLSENITIRGVKVNSNGTNNDGCDPESCRNILIEDCYFNTGDDCIALKSGRNADGRRWNKPTENVIIRNCKMQNGHGGIVIGSEISGGCRNIFAENCEMSSPQLERAIRVKTNSQRGGIIEDIFIRNITIGQVGEAVIKIDCLYEPEEGQGSFPPLVKNIYISNVISKQAQYAIYLRGIQGLTCIDDIEISECNFSGVKKNCVLKDIGEIELKNVIRNGELITLNKLH